MLTTLFFLLPSLTFSYQESREDSRLGPAPRLPVSQRYFTASPTPKAAGLMVNTSNRQEVVDFFNTIFLPALAVPPNWTGDLATCNAGSTSLAFTEATRDVINFFRAMTGLPGDIAFDSVLNAKDQQAALMMNAEGDLSHFPTTSFACFSADGADAARNSNLALGSSGPYSIDLYMEDSGIFNFPLGHRRWLLYPRQVTMGTGSTDGYSGFFQGANALWVLAPFGPRPASPVFVAWPPSGFVPYQIAYRRWSFSVNAEESQVDFSSATVTMRQGGSPVPLNILQLDQDSFGDDTIVWEPSGLIFGAHIADQTFHIEVKNVWVDSQFQDFAYNVTIIDPTLIFSDGFESGDTSAW